MVSVCSSLLLLSLNEITILKTVLEYMFLVLTMCYMRKRPLRAPSAGVRQS